MNYPSWWHWGLEFTPHLEKRMLQRDFNEIELRTMFSNATSIENDKEPGRFLITTRHKDSVWEVIVEPDDQENLIVVVTAYSTED